MDWMKMTLLLVFLSAGCASQQQLLTSSDRIVFLGDSITEMGGEPNGYVTLVADSLKAKYGVNSPHVINAGISGNKVADLQARLDRDVLSKKPTIVVIYIGINDVWHFALPGLKGTPKDAYEAGLKDITSRIRAVGAKVILCTPSVIGEKANGENPQDSLLNEYAGISRRVSGETNSQLCDLHKFFLDYLKEHNSQDVREGVLTVDGVHLDDAGNRFVAEIMLNALGA